MRMLLTSVVSWFCEDMRKRTMNLRSSPGTLRCHGIGLSTLGWPKSVLGFSVTFDRKKKHFVLGSVQNSFELFGQASIYYFSNHKIIKYKKRDTKI